MSYSPLDDSTPYSSINTGGGPTILAVWCLVLASKNQDGVTALNPSAVYGLWLGSQEPKTLEDIQKAWDYLTSPDKKSKNQEHEGRRIIPTEDGRWFVVSHYKYRQMYKTEQRRRQWSASQQKIRDAKKHNMGEGQQECLQDDLEKAAEELPAVIPPLSFDPKQAVAVPAKLRGNPLVSLACDVWNTYYGAGSADGGRIAAAVSPLSKHHSTEVILAALKRYLEESTFISKSPQDFKSHFADWLPTGKGAAKTGVARAVVRDVTQENLDSLARIKAKRGEE